MMIEKVMIQLGAHCNRKGGGGGGGGGHERGTADAEDAGKKNNWESRGAGKPPKATKPKSHLPAGEEPVMQRMRKAKAAKAAYTQ